MQWFTCFGLTISCLFMIAVVVQCSYENTDLSSCPVTKLLNTSEATFTSKNNTPIYFNISIPEHAKGSLLVRIHWHSEYCESSPTEMQIAPRIYLALNECPSESTYIRKNENHTLLVKEMLLQHVSLHPYEVADSSRGTYIVAVEQRECESMDFTIGLSLLADLNLGTQRNVRLIPGVKRFMYLDVDKDTEPRMLKVQYSYQKTDKIRFIKSTIVSVRQSTYPRGDEMDTVFHTPFFIISPLSTTVTKYYLCLDVDMYNEEPISKYVSVTVASSIGKSCPLGCGDFGVCNITTGTCMCPSGVWGDQCDIAGCVSNVECPVESGYGRTVCTSASEKKCVPYKCFDNTFFRIDLENNVCKRSFPLEVVLYISAGVMVLSAIGGFVIGISIGSCTRKRQYYHNLK